MPARVRKTVPHFGPKPHREHRSRRGRTEDYRWKRSAKQAAAMKAAKEKSRLKQRLRRQSFDWDE